MIKHRNFLMFENLKFSRHLFIIKNAKQNFLENLILSLNLVFLFQNYYIKTRS